MFLIQGQNRLYAKLADGSVTTPKLADGSVTTIETHTHDGTTHTHHHTHAHEPERRWPGGQP